MIVRGLTLFKQLWLSYENGIAMLDPGLCPYVLRNCPDVHIWHCHHPSRDFSHVSAMFTGNAYSGPNAVWDTVAYGVFVQHMQTEAYRNRSPTPRRKKSRSDGGRSLPCLTP